MQAGKYSHNPSYTKFDGTLNLMYLGVHFTHLDVGGLRVRLVSRGFEKESVEMEEEVATEVVTIRWRKLAKEMSRAR